MFTKVFSAFLLVAIMSSHSRASQEATVCGNFVSKEESASSEAYIFAGGLWFFTQSERLTAEMNGKCVCISGRIIPAGSFQSTIFESVSNVVVSQDGSKCN